MPGQPSAYRPRCCARSVAYPGASFKGQCGRPGLGRRPVIIHCTRLGSGESQGSPSAGARPLTSTTPQRCVHQKTGRLAGPHPLRGPDRELRSLQEGPRRLNRGEEDRENPFGQTSSRYAASGLGPPGRFFFPGYQIMPSVRQEGAQDTGKFLLKVSLLLLEEVLADWEG